MSAELYPRRRVLLTLRLGADSRDDLIAALNQIATEIAMLRLNGECASGGYSAGYSLNLSEDPTITHDSYFAAIDARIELDRKEEGQKCAG